MNEEKNQKPLLSYEQVVDMIEERISRDEPDNRDERIARVEKAAEELEAKKRKKGWRRYSFLRFWRRLFRPCCGK